MTLMPRWQNRYLRRIREGVLDARDDCANGATYLHVSRALLTVPGINMLRGGKYWSSWYRGYAHTSNHLNADGKYNGIQVPNRSAHLNGDRTITIL